MAPKRGVGSDQKGDLGPILLLGEKRDPILSKFDYLWANRDPPEGPLGGLSASSGVQKHPKKHTEKQPGFRDVFLTSLGAKSNQYVSPFG